MAGNILRHPIYKERFGEEEAGKYPVADQVMREGFVIGCHHGMNEEDVDRLCGPLIGFAKSHLDKAAIEGSVPAAAVAAPPDE